MIVTSRNVWDYDLRDNPATRCEGDYNDFKTNDINERNANEMCNDRC